MNLNSLDTAARLDQEGHLVADMVVVGSGGAGMSAAIVGALHGLEVVLVEKTPYFGGATAWSGGGCWVPANHLMESAGLMDDSSRAAAYGRAVVGDVLDEVLFERFLRYSPEMLRYFEAHTQVCFELGAGMADYYQDLPGASANGRLLVPAEFDGRSLGKWFAALRPPLKEFNAPGGMMIGLGDAEYLSNVRRSPRAFLYVLRMLGRYGLDRLGGYGRGTRLTMGNALAARLLASAREAGVTLWNNCAATELLREGGRVAGLRVVRDGRAQVLRARRGVVLASGGFSGDGAMRACHFPYPDQHQALMPEGNTGDGLRMGCSAGAWMHPRNPNNASWITVSLRRQKDGSLQKFPHLFLDKPKPGCIAVNRLGCRFGNEASLAFIEAMHASGSVPAWLICDSRFIRKYGLGLVYPGGLGLKRLVGEGYLVEGATVARLAESLEIPAQALERTVAEFNRHALAGQDPQFGRGSSPFDRALGDSEHLPNPSLGPIETGPFYAVRIYPGSTTTTLGLRVDGHGRALGADGQAIPGLYACGLDMNSLWAGRPPANGCNNALNLTLGYLIARHLAGADCE